MPASSTHGAENNKCRHDFCKNELSIWVAPQWFEFVGKSIGCKVFVGCVCSVKNRDIGCSTLASVFKKNSKYTWFIINADIMDFYHAVIFFLSEKFLLGKKNFVTVFLPNKKILSSKKKFAKQNF